MDEYGLSSIIIWNTCLYVPLYGVLFQFDTGIIFGWDGEMWTIALFVWIGIWT